MFPLGKWIEQLLGSDYRNTFVTSVVEARDPDGIYSKELDQMMTRSLCAEGVEGKLINADNHLERVAILEANFSDANFKQILKGLEKQFTKNAEISNLIEKRGDEMDVNSDYEKILRCHNLAILFAPVHDGCLGKKYAKRAEFFHSVLKPELCLADIQLALTQDCTEDMIKRLKDMETECVPLIQNKENKISADVIKLRSYRDNDLFQLKGNKNSKIPCAIDGIRMEFDEKRERHLITERHLAPGTTVIVEEPFAKCLINLTKWDTRHCSTCLEKIEQGIPCSNCVFVTYCSDACRLADWEGGHSYECPCLAFLHAMQTSSTKLLAFKILCKEGPTSLYKCWVEDQAEQEQSPSTTNLISGFNPETGTFDSDSYYQIRKMKSHKEENSLSLITWYALTAIKTLDHLTPFFQNHDQNDFKRYVASMFMTHAIAFLCNAVSLSEEISQVNHEAEGLQYSHTVEFTNAVYSVICIMSHSCDTNVIRQNRPDGKMAIITKRELNPGDELLFSYGYEFLIHKLSHRQSEIEENYHFRCPCVPCTLKWPVFSELDPKRTFLCPNCSDHFKDCRMTQTKLCGLTPPNSGFISSCKNCKEEIQLQELNNMANVVSINIRKAEKLIGKESPIEAIPLIVDSITKFQALLCPPSKETITAEILLSEAFIRINTA